MSAAFDAAVRRHRLVAILRGVPRETLEARVAALHGAGVRLIEVALSEPTALGVLEDLVRIAPADLLVGAGTVTTRALAEAAHATGATFLVTPHVALPTIAYAREHDLGMLAGALTPTDIASARDAGARFIKLFPASIVGPEYVKALLGPYPDLELLAVGGVGSDTLAPYLRAGAIGAGVGGALASGSPDDGFASAATEARALLRVLDGQ
ncbi:MAG: bifunctional 4-hydroxy-2-oxoglutarate aldolase/2-dehydro-3-deoxy-phosphogluconate aldolase [Trueperaceae bacterium]|nr:bifunctional 4-hydroxy-2-oxoglutarate aldolase/2-dehydro-3-deoxy-phosphogluconate aldolase [Trueperaceae bacterium]